MDYPTIYVNTRGEASFFIKARVKVGPVFSSCLGKIIFSCGRTLEEVKDYLEDYDYKQKQIGELNEPIRF